MLRQVWLFMIEHVKNKAVICNTKLCHCIFKQLAGSFSNHCAKYINDVTVSSVPTCVCIYYLFILNYMCIFIYMHKCVHAHTHTREYTNTYF